MKKEHSHRLRLWFFGGMTLLIMAAIFFFSSQTGLKSGALSERFLASLIGSFLKRVLPHLSKNGMSADIRKYAHMAEYFSLGICVFLFQSELYRWNRPSRAAAFSLLICFLYACSDEMHQLFVPGRAGMFRDVLIDGVGFGSGILISLIPAAAAAGRRADQQE